MAKFVASFIVFSVSAFIVAGCQSKQVAVPPGINAGSQSPGGPRVVVPTAPPLELKSPSSSNLTARALTSAGDNSEARFSADGARMLFLSRSRPSHKHAQVYELDLVRMTERRLTFHDTEDRAPIWWGADRFAYSSATDEIKTEEKAIDRMRKLVSSSSKPDDFDSVGDLYVQTLDGRTIERITNDNGLETEPTRDNAGNVIFTVRDKNGRTGLYLFGQNSKRRLSTGDTEDRRGRLSPDGKKLAWLRKASAGSRLFLSESLQLKAGKAMTEKAEKVRDFDWHPAGTALIYATSAGREPAGLTVIDLERNCRANLTEVQFEPNQPTFHPDGRRIAFTASTSAGSQIYVVETDWKSLPCEPIPASVAD